MPEAPSTEALTLRPLHWLLLLLCTAALYYPAIQFDYLNYDDHLYLLEDPAIRSLGLANLKTILFEPYFAAWYPLTRLSRSNWYRGTSHKLGWLLDMARYSGATRPVPTWSTSCCTC